jgi:hypothetical protein
MRGLEGLKRLFWQEFNYERENKPLSTRQWPIIAKCAPALAENPVLFAIGARITRFTSSIAGWPGRVERGCQRPIVDYLLRDHPYALFRFSQNKAQTAWHFLNVNMTNRPKNAAWCARSRCCPATAADGGRTPGFADLRGISPDLFGLSPLLISNIHDDARSMSERVTKDFYREIANWYFWAREPGVFPKDAHDRRGWQALAASDPAFDPMIFCWFLKEKRILKTGEGLLPEALSSRAGSGICSKTLPPNHVPLHRDSPESLFFATLSHGNGQSWLEPLARFVTENDRYGSDDHMVPTVLAKTKSSFATHAALEAVLRQIPS